MFFGHEKDNAVSFDQFNQIVSLFSLTYLILLLAAYNLSITRPWAI